MRAWLFLVGGMIVWAAQFFTLYAIASVLGSSGVARVLTGVATLAALAADAVLLRGALAARHDDDPVRRWHASFAALLAAISLVAVAWQGLPALLA